MRLGKGGDFGMAIHQRGRGSRLSDLAKTMVRVLLLLGYYFSAFLCLIESGKWSYPWGGKVECLVLAGVSRRVFFLPRATIRRVVEFVHYGPISHVCYNGLR